MNLIEFRLVHNKRESLVRSYYFQFESKLKSISPSLIFHVTSAEDIRITRDRTIRPRTIRLRFEN